MRNYSNIKELTWAYTYQIYTQGKRHTEGKQGQRSAHEKIIGRDRSGQTWNVENEEREGKTKDRTYTKKKKRVGKSNKES